METPQHLPTVKQLRYFVALCDERHFGRAAARCFVSQSAFSLAIQEFEGLLGAQLVDRTRRRVTVTAVGQDVAAMARMCLRDLGALAAVARGQGRPLEGNLHLGVIPSIAPFLLPRALPGLRRSHPKLRLFLYEDLTAQLHERLLDGSLDLALVALPFDLPGLEHHELFRDAFVLAARQGTAHVDPEHYRFNQLQKGTVLLLREGHCLRDHAIAACRMRQAEKTHAFSASSLLTLIEMVDADLGITFLPKMAEGSALLKNTRVRTYPLTDGSFRSIALVWRQGSARAEEFRLLGDKLAAPFVDR